jgi:cephalosporin hydroxylase
LTPIASFAKRLRSNVNSRIVRWGFRVFPSKRVLGLIFWRTRSQGSVLRLQRLSPESRLRELFTKYGSDKDWVGNEHPPYPWRPHKYADVYEMLFSAKRHGVRVVVECGIGTNNVDFPSNMTSSGRPGASLRAWRDFFPSAEIIGVDIDSRVLFSEERIRCYQVDQTDRISVERFWATTGIEEADIIIDDGLHTFEAGSAFFQASISRLKIGGFYVIEDVQLQDFVKFADFFESRPEIVYGFSVHRDGVPISDNTLLVISRPMQP